MPIAQDDDHFKNFAGALSGAIGRYKDMDKESLVERQKRQIERLVALEDEFRETLISHPHGPGVYKAFIRFICDQRRNILDARPYFRERQPVFTSQISPALKMRSYQSLYRFHFNFGFVKFAVNSRTWAPKSKVLRLGKEINSIRTELIEQNMPLAITRARIFYSSTPKARLTYMDFVQIAAEGLMSGIDKFCLPYSKRFRHTAIGRMIGNFIENYSQTDIHFYPLDKRKLYRANKALRHKDRENIDFSELAKAINVDLEPEQKTNSVEIANLLAAASTVSADAKDPNDPEGRDPMERFVGSDDLRPDVRAERADLYSALAVAIQKLPMRERKLLQMRGISL